jgi:lantibiotic modifying enzyme
MMTTACAWSPLLAGDLAATALEAVEAIAADLAATASLISPFGPDPEFSLASGTAGQALFLAYLDEAVPGRGYGVLSRDLLEQAVEVAATLRPSPDQPLDPSQDRSQDFYTGRSGVVWTVEHLRSRRRADAVGEVPWDREALAFARRAAGRGGADSGAVNPGLRQGAAGIAHLCNRLFQATGEEPFANAARAGFGRVLETRRRDEGIGGFKVDPGFLNGAAGIGLALLAAISSHEPAWDRLLPALIPSCSSGWAAGAGRVFAGGYEAR